MAGALENHKVAVLATDGVEQSELSEPVSAPRGMGATVDVIAPKPGTIQAWKHFDKADRIGVDKTIADADPSFYDALVLPGGVTNPDQLRTDGAAVAFVREFVQEGKTIGAICHGPWTLIEAGGIKGRRMTSWPSLRSDLLNAGARWEDSEVVTDGGLVTSRKPADLPAFCRKLAEEIREGREPADYRSAAVRRSAEASSSGRKR